MTADYNPATSTAIIYNPVETGSGTTSQTVTSSNTFEYLLPQALYECLQYRESTQCNILANLCVYQMYTESAAPCKAFINMQTSITTQQNSFYGEGWRTGLPWIYYVDDGSTVIKNNAKIEGKAEFQTTSTSKLGTLYFRLGMYSLEGDFLGFQNLTTQLQLCPADYQYGVDYREFGRSVSSKCNYNVSQLIDTALLPNNTDVFYDLWLVDVNDNYIDVPVKILNYVDSDGNFPNRKSSKSSWKFVRRFFIYDTKSGLEGTDSYTNGVEFGTYVRWIDMVKLVIELDFSGNSEIFVPYLEIEYRSKAKSFIPDSATTSVSFETVYKMDPSSFWVVAWIFFGISHVLILISTCWKIYAWTSRHPRVLMGSVYTYKLVLNILFFFIESWSSVIFWYLFAVAASFYAFFKLGTTPYLLLPQDESGNLLPWAIIFAFVFVFKMIVIGLKIAKQ